MITLNDTIRSVHEKMTVGTVRVSDVMARIRKQDEQLNGWLRAYTYKCIDPDVGEECPVSNGTLLAGVPYAVQDTICVKGLPLTCSSKILEGFTPGYDATVVAKINKQGGVLTGKLNSSEFGLGAGSGSSVFSTTRNPWYGRDDESSTSGAAAAVAAGQIWFSLGTDAAGELRQDAAVCGLAALKPTFPTVSKHGLAASVPSMEQIGIAARHMDDCEDVWRVLLGQDPLDSTVISHPQPDITESGDLSGLRVGILTTYFQAADASAQEAVRQTAQRLRHAGARVEECFIEYLQESLQASFVLVCSEASSSLARYDGVRYGYRTHRPRDVLSMYMKTRREGLSENTRQTVLAGTHFLSVEGHEQYYKQAARLRTRVSQSIQGALDEYDCLLAPVVAEGAPAHLSALWPAFANLAGLPALTFPGMLFAGKPVGVQLIGKAFAEPLLLRMGRKGCITIDWEQVQENFIQAGGDGHD